MHFFLYQVALWKWKYLPTSKDISGYKVKTVRVYFGDIDPYPAMEKDATRKAKETGNGM